ncbi:hypothetical protein FLB_23500 [Flavobacterium succinicans]|uniref:Uncharacterized protein n=1 Tax=Flavobacterium succinicans TaxID=29536 RepID=A0A199XP34_9FLAO|nr:hypothetical protein FLB_23500 [Flavobacterium succinicans]
MQMKYQMSGLKNHLKGNYLLSYFASRYNFFK